MEIADWENAADAPKRLEVPMRKNVSVRNPDMVRTPRGGYASQRFVPVERCRTPVARTGYDCWPILKAEKFYLESWREFSDALQNTAKLFMKKK
jgi:hypothetical protein